MKISRKVRRELMLIAFDLVDGQVDDLEAMCEILEAIAAAGRKELEAKASA
ncbi:hypothetical protein Riv7116_4832 [Rivularia sp. PCC 7116]|uniref:hypothetical protein n=1 Tax=Rivularia sp. PCC 7116 TaxID=373994 RepID=UPI00029F4CA7|nr:hypothetical protein [Rivularia sp. PCC 7116]AFY57243.1 hypothetical protein Riv7116_4832 [Rivularia sp. PCC 7116]